jgi:hypothetical protein
MLVDAVVGVDVLGVDGCEVAEGVSLLREASLMVELVPRV